jgi:hypothetical protein
VINILLLTFGLNDGTILFLGVQIFPIINKEGPAMKYGEIKAKAELVGVTNPSPNRTELIKQIQQAEGFSICFKTKSDCDQKKCCWRNDCLKN